MAHHVADAHTDAARPEWGGQVPVAADLHRFGGGLVDGGDDGVGTAAVQVKQVVLKAGGDAVFARHGGDAGEGLTGDRGGLGAHVEGRPVAWLRLWPRA